MNKINLIWFTENYEAVPSWHLGLVFPCQPSPLALLKIMEAHQINQNQVDAWLFWDSSIDLPSADVLTSLMNQPADVWHAGLSTGTQSQPKILEHLNPGWMYTVDPDVLDNSVSWRLNLRCCLIRSWVLKEFGLPIKDLSSLDVASLQLGYLYFRAGAIIKNSLALVNKNINLSYKFSFQDQIKFVLNCFDKKWFYWVLFKTFLFHPFDWIKSIGFLRQHQTQRDFKKRVQTIPNRESDVKISVILPTLKRYQYLPACLDSLMSQTLKPFEIICVDQNDFQDRQVELYERYSHLPLKVIWQDQKGQSTARNRGVVEAQGEWLFFADDDSVYPPDALQKHLELVRHLGADASTGLSIPPRKYKVPDDYDYVRVAHNLDTGNSLIKKAMVLRVGGFDLNFDQGKGADLDLGMRIYRQSGLIIHNPLVQRVHYKAAGGLREYGVLWDNRSVQKNSPKPPVTISYFFLRHFPKKIAYRTIIQTVLFVGLPSSQVFEGRNVKALKSLLVSFLKFPCRLPMLFKSIVAAQKMVKQGPRLLNK